MNRVIQYIVDLFCLPTNVRSIMATLAEINAKLVEADEATNNIAADVQGLKEKLDEAIADTAGQVDAAVTAALQAVSDGLNPVVSKLQTVAAATDDSEPVDPPVDPEV